jgi:hypothetical protein
MAAPRAGVIACRSRLTDAVRVPPHSVEAEQAVLGGLMLDATAWDASPTSSPPRTSTAATTG